MKIPALLLSFALSLPVAQAAWKPVEGKMMTTWGESLDPAKVWSEYPRPELQRDAWVNLNGLWSYAVTPQDAAAPAEWAGEILVPFCPESTLSGVGRVIEPTDTLWYRRSLPVKATAGKRTILHFEAVDYTMKVAVNGREVGAHTGAHTPSDFDITDALTGGENVLTVSVQDATGEYQLVGKQKRDPGGIWYTRVSGIWQTVWLEQVPETFITDLDFASDIKAGTLTVTTKTAAEGTSVRVEASLDGAVVARGAGKGPVTLTIPGAKLWSPDSPTLYDVKVELLDAAGAVVDTVKSYSALRELGKARDKNGNLRFTLNGKPIFHWGPLDQGWWPDGLLTPPSDAAMLSDIEFLKAAGFNMIRKHIKVEPRRYYYHCDRLGMMVWQDQVSNGYGPDSGPQGSNPPWTRLAPAPQDGTWPDAAHEQWVTEYKRMVDHLRDHPSVVVWSPYNEAWGQHRSMESGQMALACDSTRPVNIASGGNFWPVGDIADEHAYPDPAFPFGDKRFDDYVKVAGEFGGHGWPVEGHLWRKGGDNWGYGGLPKTQDEWKERYRHSIEVLRGLRRQGVSAGVYTQTTDVEGEINGLLTYDRKQKVDPAWLNEVAQTLLKTPDTSSLTVIAENSEKSGQEWHYTTDKPAGGWQAADFADGAWKKGPGGFGTADTPNTHVRTEWKTPDIWLRREFTVATLPAGRPVLQLHHDEDATVYLNGVEIARVPGFNAGYRLIDLSDAAVAALKTGRNVLAVHCHQTKGGQYIDAGLVSEVAD